MAMHMPSGYVFGMDLIFAYLAGLLTLINPCVLPVLPIVLASALNADRRGREHHNQKHEGAQTADGT